jgi:SAM-dependent methyltransferase
MAGGILFVHGGDEFARHVFDAEGRAYMSRGLPAMLEKHGLLAIAEAEPEVLEDAGRLAAYDAVLVARLPDAAWTPAAISGVRGGAEVLAEGPLPAAVAQALGVTRYGPLWSKGELNVLDDDVVRLGGHYRLGVGGEIAWERLTRVDRRPESRNWALAKDPPFSMRQASAWAAPAWDWEPWRLRGDAEVVAEWTDPKRGTFPAIVRRGGFTGCAFGLFAAIAAEHSIEPFWADTTQSYPARRGMEGLLLGLIDAMHARRGRTRPRVLPWPVGIDWVRTVRHDFDRPLDAAKTREVLERHRRHGSRATWYWRAVHADCEALGIVAADEHHEVALHAQDVWFGNGRERAAVEEKLGRGLSGVTAHGGHDSFRFQGAANVVWAASEGFAYTELPTRRQHVHPFRFVTVRDDGRVELEDIVVLPGHLSLDRSVKDGDAQPDVILHEAPRWSRAGGLVQIMNHPDLNQAGLDDVLRETALDARGDWTAAQAADWWRRTHSRAAVQMSVSGSGSRVTVTSELGIENARIEFLRPDGARHERPLSVPVGGRVSVVDGSDDALPSWEEVEARFRDSALHYYRSHGRDLESSAVRATLRSNTELVPGRSRTLRRLAEAATGEASLLEGRRVLEIGTGFGSLAAHYLVADGAAAVVGIDVRRDFVDTASAIARALGVEHSLDFQVGDMRHLDELADAEFDVVIANNSLYYVPERRGVAKSIREFHRVLAPGGWAIVYQANRWRRDDAFTRDPIVHLLPAPLARAVGRVTGWKHSHGRVEFISPPDLRLRFRRAGFRSVKTVGSDRGQPLGGWRGHFTEFFCLGARR